MQHDTTSTLLPPVNTHVDGSSVSGRVDEINVRPAKIGQTVIVDGQLFIDSTPVCPVCLEDLGSDFCGYTHADLAAFDIGWQPGRRHPQCGAA